ncbi:hypothetical protein LY15_000371 [Prauserella flava]|nr:hypothetical protein [Prauserella flava]MCR3732980.1 hypothetical protein [Prauserella salsuginis]
MSSDNSAERARRRSARDLLKQSHGSDSNVNGFALGRRRRGGQRMDESVVVVYVSRKDPPELVARDRLLPASVPVDGIDVPVDVVEAGPFYALGSPDVGADESGPDVLEHTERVRPVRTGASIGHVDISAGTVGCLVRDNTDGSRQVLSNNHVLANMNDAEVGDPVVQPGPADGGVDPADRVATLTRWVDVVEDGNRVDCAIAAPTDDALISGEVMDEQMPPVSPEHPAVGLLFAGDCSGRIIGCRMTTVLEELDVTLVAGDAAAAEPEEDMVVEKVGRTTEYTSSVIEDDEVVVMVGFGGITAEFVDCFAVPGFGHAGDSGSIICVGGEGDTRTDNRCE